MSFHLIPILFASLLLAIAPAVASQAEVLFFADFESVDALDDWEIESTETGRVRIAEDPDDPSNHGLLMDDSVSNAVFSQNYARTSVSIGGYTEVVVSVDIYSFNDEVHFGENGDGIVLRAGSVSRAYPIEWKVRQHIEIALDAELMAAAYPDGFLTIELRQYDNFSMPDDGLLFDNVTVTGRKARAIFVESPLRVLESEPFPVTVLLDPVPTEDVVLTLRKSGQVHGTAVYPAGMDLAELVFPNLENNRLDGDRVYTFELTDGYFESASFYVTVEDTTVAGLALALPEEIAEGTSAYGVASVSVQRDSSILIYLESSDPSVLQVPNTVVLGRYNSTVGFALTTIKDPQVLADREVTITARVGGDVVEMNVFVTEVNSLIPVLSGPVELKEGATEIRFEVALSGISVDPVSIELEATPAGITINPQTILLEPGQSKAYFTVSVDDDEVAQGNRDFTITATTRFGVGTFEGTILDNDFSQFVFDVPTKIQANSQYPLQIRATNLDGSTVAAYEGIATVDLDDPQTDSSERLGEVTFVDGKATFPLNLPYSARGRVLVVRSENGIEARSQPLFVFANLAFGANDLVYDSTRERLYTVSGGAAIAGHLHSVTPINPATAEIGNALFLGNDPQNMVITEDNQYLYVGLWGSYSVQRIKLDTFTRGTNFVLNASSVWSGDSFRPYRLLTVPGRPRDLLVSQRHVGSTYRTTRLYIDGEVQPVDSRDAYELAHAGSLNEFYGVYSSNFKRFRLKSDGFEAVTSSRDIPGLGNQIVGADDIIFSSTGKVVDGLEMRVIAQLPFPSGWSTGYGSPSVTMFVDTGLSRIYYARGNEIAAYDTEVFQLVSQTSIPGIGNIKRIVRWGDAGIGLLTDQAKVVLFEDKDIVPNGAVTDLSVAISASPDPVFLDEELIYTASVENSSDVAATKVRLVFDFNEGHSIRSVVSPGFEHSIQNRNVVIDVGEMNPGDRQEFSVITVPTALTTLVGTAVAVTQSPDSDYANNKASTVLNVGFDSQPNSLNLVKIPINDVLFEPVSGELVVAVSANANAGVANHILRIDPASGLITRSILMPSEPKKLALSDDGSTAYALPPLNTSAMRVNLDTGQLEASISFSVGSGTISATDLKVLPGTIDSILIATGSYGARVFDNGVPRPQTSGTTGSFVELLPAPDLAFSFNTQHTGFDSAKLQITSAGVQTVVKSGGLFSGFQTRIKSDGYFIYGTDGKGVRADLMVIDGTFPLSTAFSGSSFGTAPVEPDRAGQRVYYARGKQIASFDSETYLHVRTQEFENLPSSIASFERWGVDGFAARLENGELAIIRTDLISDTAGSIDLMVSIPDNHVTAGPDLLVTGQAFSGQGISSVTINGETATSANAFASWSLNIADLTPGEHVMTITATAFGNPAATRTITRIVHVPAGGYSLSDEWVLEHFGELNSPRAAPGLDADEDGLSNLAEFLFGTNPTEPDTVHFTISRSEGEDGQYLSLEFMHRDLDKSIFTVESSSDLIVWGPFSGTIEQPNDPVPVEGKPNYLISTYRLLPTEESRGEFYRILVQPD